MDLEQIPDVIQIDQWSSETSHIKLKADESPLAFLAFDEDGDEIMDKRCLTHLNWSLDNLDHLWASTVILSLEPSDVAPTELKIDSLKGELEAGSYLWQLSLEDSVREHKTY